MQPSDQENGSVPAAISEDEIALYDRQIRLWGMQAQEKIRKASVLLVTLRALGNEVAKNLVLAGISSLTVLDPGTVSEADLGAQFFLARPAPVSAPASASTADGIEKGQNDDEDSIVGRNRATVAAPAIQKLNPRVQIHIDEGRPEDKDPSYFQAFDVIIATDVSPSTIQIINKAARAAGRPFYAAACHGSHGFLFSDLVEHEYVIQRDSGNVLTKPGSETRTRSVVDVRTKKDGHRIVESVTKRELYSPFSASCLSADLPAEYTSSRSKRRLRSVSPVLSCLRALWDFSSENGGALPDASKREDLQAFTRGATERHAALGLPAETLTPEVLRRFLQGVGCEIAPVAAILGGQLAQDVINVLGCTQQPIQNTVVLDGDAMEAPMYALHPEGPLGKGFSVE